MALATETWGCGRSKLLDWRQLLQGFGLDQVQYSLRVDIDRLDFFNGSGVSIVCLMKDGGVDD